MHKSLEWVLLGCGMLAPAIYLFSIFYAAAGYPNYRHRSQFISELGAHNSPKAAYFNAGFVVTGILLVAFAFGVTGLSSSHSAKPAQLGLGFFGFTVMLMGFFPCDSGCPRVPISRTGMAHGLSGLLGAVVLAATMTYLGLAWQEATSAFTIYSLMTALMSIFSLIILTVWQMPRWQGLLQRFYASMVFGWLLTLSLLLLIKKIGFM